MDAEAARKLRLLHPERTFAVAPRLLARDAVVTPEVARALTTVHEWTLALDARRESRFTREIPNVADATLVHLDERGLIRVGAPVKAGSILVGRVLLRRLRDSSLRVPPGVRGVVVRARMEGEEADVTIRCERPLVVGDLLRLDDGTEAIVGDVVASLGGTEVGWPHLAATGTRRVEKVQCTEDVAHARSIGPYSLVTQQPLTSRETFGGQRVGIGEIRGLLGLGAGTILHEMLTVKSDDVDGRYRLYESLVQGRPRAVATTPWSTRSAQARLRALGLEVDLEASGPYAITVATTASIRARTVADVRLGDTFAEDTHDPVAGGLFCADTFGAIGSDDRWRREGRIDLPRPIVHPLGFAEVAARLGMDEGSARALAYRHGAEEIRTALEAVGADASDLVLDAWPVLPPELRPLVRLDAGGWAGSNLNDLYGRVIDLRNRVERLLAKGAPDAIVQGEQRALQIAVEDVVLNGYGPHAAQLGPKGPLRPLVETLVDPGGPLTPRKSCDYSGTAVVVASPTAGARAMLPRSLALELWKPWIYDVLESAGHARSIKAAKALVDRCDPRALAALEEVTRDHPLVVFPLPAGLVSSVVALGVSLWDELAFGLAPDVIEALGVAAPGATVAFHVPVDPIAIEEARKRLAPGGTPLPIELGAEMGWIARAAQASPEQLGPLLFRAALDGEEDEATGPIARIVLGLPL